MSNFTHTIPRPTSFSAGLLTIVAIILSSSQIAYAGGSLNIAFTTSEKLWICNAGISRPSGAALNQPSSLSDELNVTYFDATLPLNDSLGQKRNVSFTPLTLGKTHALFDPNSFPAQQQVLSLQIGLNSENYGTGWFIDTCYLGPLPIKAANGADLTQGFYTLDFSVSGADPTYARNSGLTAQLSYQCDLRAVGQWIGPPGNEVNVPGFVPDVDAEGESSALSPAGFNQLNWQYAINSKAIEVPRTCRIRITFQENNFAGNRTWTTPTSQFTLLTNIN